MVDDHGPGAVGGRGGQQGQQFAVPPPLALDLVVGQQQGEDQVGGQQGRGGEGEDVPEAQAVVGALLKTMPARARRPASRLSPTGSRP